MKTSAATLCALLLIAGCGDASDAPLMLQGYGEARFTYIAAEESGRLSKVLVQDGQNVTAGETLFELDSSRVALAAESASSAAAAASARANQGGALGQAVRLAEAEADVARQNLNRTRALFDRGLIARARLDSDLAAARAADARLAQARAEQNAARTDAGGAGANSRLARRRVTDMRIAAPIDGQIHMVYRRLGEVVGAGAPLAAMIAPGDMRVRFFAPQAALSRFAPGARVMLACDGCKSGLTARVAFVAMEPQFTPPVIYSRDQRSKLVFLIEAIPDDPAGVRPGLPIEVSLAP